MITQLEVFTPGITTPPLPVGEGTTARDQIQIRKIDGLQPVAADVNTTKYGSVDNEFYNGSSTGKRNIVLTLGLNPNWRDQTMESLRMIVYSYFMPKSFVRLRFTSTHLPTVEITGYVETCEPTIFSKDGEIAVSIICPNSEFVATEAMVVPGITDAIGGTAETVINYTGSVDTGVVLDVTLPTGHAAFTGEVRFINKVSGTKIFIVSNVAVDTTKFLRISTVPGDKFVDECPLPSGLPTSVMGNVAAGSIWIPLKKGNNRIQVMSTGANLIWTLQYYAKYGGL